MRQRSLLLIGIAILGMLVVLGLQGCLFGGGGGDEAADSGGEAAEGAPDGAEGMPAEGAEGMPAEPGEPGEMPPEGGMGGPPPGDMGGAPGEMPMEGTPPAEAGAGGDAGTLVAQGMAAKHDGDYVTARAQFEAAIAAAPDNVDAHYGLAWVLAEMAASGQPNLKSQAIAEFQKVLELGGTDDQIEKATKALDRLQ